MSRGWDVFNVGTDDCPRLEIQRDDEAEVFPDDLAALRAVIRAAANGDEHAERALYTVNFQDREGWADWNGDAPESL